MAQKKLTRNDRGIELNRDFSNVVQHGFMQGLLKVNQSGTRDCVNEGLSVFRAVLRMIFKMIFGGIEQTEMDV